MFKKFTPPVRHVPESMWLMARKISYKLSLKTATLISQQTLNGIRGACRRARRSGRHTFCGFRRGLTRNRCVDRASLRDR